MVELLQSLPLPCEADEQCCTVSGSRSDLWHEHLLISGSLMRASQDIRTFGVKSSFVCVPSDGRVGGMTCDMSQRCFSACRTSIALISRISSPAVTMLSRSAKRVCQLVFRSSHGVFALSEALKRDRPNRAPGCRLSAGYP